MTSVPPSSSDQTTTGPPVSSLPSHPTARAFFDALDSRKNKNNSNDNTKKQSAFIQKRLSTLGWRNRHSQDAHYPLEVQGQTFSVLQIQRGEIEETYGTGACVWPAAVVLVKYMERHCQTLLQGKTVVDLGSGTGKIFLVTFHHLCLIAVVAHIENRCFLFRFWNKRNHFCGSCHFRSLSCCLYRWLRSGCSVGQRQHC